MRHPQRQKNASSFAERRQAKMHRKKITHQWLLMCQAGFPFNRSILCSGVINNIERGFQRRNESLESDTAVGNNAAACP